MTAQASGGQTGQAAQCTGPGGVGLERLLHPSKVPKLHLYDGKKEGWEKFKHVFVAWSFTVHPKFPELLD